MTPRGNLVDAFEVVLVEGDMAQEGRIGGVQPHGLEKVALLVSYERDELRIGVHDALLKREGEVVDRRGVGGGGAVGLFYHDVVDDRGSAAGGIEGYVIRFHANGLQVFVGVSVDIRAHHGVDACAQQREQQSEHEEQQRRLPNQLSVDQRALSHDRPP